MCAQGQLLTQLAWLRRASANCKRSLFRNTVSISNLRARDIFSRVFKELEARKSYNLSPGASQFPLNACSILGSSLKTILIFYGLYWLIRLLQLQACQLLDLRLQDCLAALLHVSGSNKQMREVYLFMCLFQAL